LVSVPLLAVAMAIAEHLLLPTHLKDCIALDIFRGASFPKLRTYTFFVALIPTSAFYGSALAFMNASCIPSSYDFYNQFLMHMY